MVTTRRLLTTGDGSGSGEFPSTANLPYDLDDAVAQLGQCTFSILLRRAPVEVLCAHARVESDGALVCSASGARALTPCPQLMVLNIPSYARGCDVESNDTSGFGAAVAAGRPGRPGIPVICWRTKLLDEAAAELRRRLGPDVTDATTKILTTGVSGQQLALPLARLMSVPLVACRA